MARAFRAGVEKERRIRAPVTQRVWKNLNDLKGSVSVLLVQKNRWVNW